MSYGTGSVLQARKLASSDPPQGWENSWTNFTAGMGTNLSPSPPPSSPPSPPNDTNGANGAAAAPSPSSTSSSYGELGLAPSTPLAGILIAIVAAAVVILTSASIVGVLRYTVTRSRRRRQLERYSQDRRRNNDASRSLQEEVSVSGHSQPDHDHDQQYQQSKLPAIVIQPDGHTVDFAVEEDMMEGGQKEDRPDPVRRNNTRRPFLVTVEVLNSGADHESSEKDPSTQDVK